MAFSNRKDMSGITSAAVIVLIQSHVKLQQFMVGALGGNVTFTVPNGDSVYNGYIDIFVGGGKLTQGTSIAPADYYMSSATTAILTNAPSTQPECSYVAQ
jgi:hypothetical protein